VLTTDIMRPLDDPKVQIVVELMGGLEPAGTVVRHALARGKAVVTANKRSSRWVARIWSPLAPPAVPTLRYEGAVAGAIPVISTLRGTLVGNRIPPSPRHPEWHHELHPEPYDRRRHSLRRRAARCPGQRVCGSRIRALTISGLDAAQKLVILTRHAYGEWVSPDAVKNTGIARVSQADIAKRASKGVDQTHCGSQPSGRRTASARRPTRIAAAIHDRRPR